MKKKLLIITGALLVNIGYAQGCSDAGICSINKGFQQEKTAFKNKLEISAIYSLGEADLVYVSPYVSYTKRFNEQYSFTAKVTFSTASGSFGTRSQFGDAFLVGNYAFTEKNQRQWSALLGLKFPFTASNLKINGYSLPLDYQSSLGTIDVFVGANYQYKQWSFNGALQIPVVNLNKNSYFSEYAGTDDFPSTNLFHRQPDALVRAIYSIPVANQKITFKPNVLFIYHLGEDSYESIFGEREKIRGSDGLTINGNLLTSCKLSPQSSIELSLATPFVVRTIRPDGLTRSFVAGLHYQYSF
ncbi:PorP/SprF family type IX secretion system membrane protein [Flavobacterium sedimenticola]|uniref:Transporter n=1 Tax=Flavobacterium sedimenticola TaxID=3043286 RepID=A0ABT6XSD1_9FLAO|nr:hypothetical protein [Flavobacterium sedimenticola]MDI9258009.1 hypothetical protein [Flavobacterium sedimenticola]